MSGSEKSHNTCRTNLQLKGVGLFLACVNCCQQVHVVYFVSIDNFNQEVFWKKIFELRIKAKVFTKCIYKCTRLAFWFLPCINFAELYFEFSSWHITILFPPLYINKYVNICLNSQYLLCRTFNESHTLLKKPHISLLH